MGECSRYIHVCSQRRGGRGSQGRYSEGREEHARCAQEGGCGDHGVMISDGELNGIEGLRRED